MGKEYDSEIACRDGDAMFLVVRVTRIGLNSMCNVSRTESGGKWIIMMSKALERVRVGTIVVFLPVVSSDSTCGGREHMCQLMVRQLI